MRIIFALVALAATLFLQGCFLMNPPQVELKSAPIVNVSSVPLPEALGIADLGSVGPSTQDGVSLTGIVAIDLSQKSEADHYIYWHAGTNRMSYQVGDSYRKSARWDMRVTDRIPIIGSNGGMTALEEGVDCVPDRNTNEEGRAAFAVVPDSWRGAIPTRVDDVTGLEFVIDRYEGIEYGGLRLGEQLQNPIVNAIGPGLLRDYNPENHNVTLSQRIFILRTVDGGSYYAIRFYFYSRRSNVIAFQWRKLL